MLYPKVYKLTFIQSLPDMDICTQGETFNSNCSFQINCKSRLGSVEYLNTIQMFGLGHPLVTTEGSYRWAAHIWKDITCSRKKDGGYETSQLFPVLLLPNEVLPQVPGKQTSMKSIASQKRSLSSTDTTFELEKKSPGKVVSTTSVFTAELQQGPEVEN